MTIRLHIERLVLDGLPIPPGARAELLETIQAELTLQLGQLDLNGVRAAHHRSLQLQEAAPGAGGPGLRPLGARIATTTLQALDSLQTRGPLAIRGPLQVPGPQEERR